MDHRLLAFFLLALVRLAGYPFRTGIHAFLLCIPGSGLVLATPLQPWFRLHPLLYVGAIFLAATLILRAFAARETRRDIDRMLKAALVVVALALVPTNAARLLVRLAFADGSAAGALTVGLVVAGLASLLFVLFVGLVAFRFERLGPARPLALVYAATLAVGLVLVFAAERILARRVRTDASGRWLENFQFGPRDRDGAVLGRAGHRRGRVVPRSRRPAEVAPLRRRRRPRVGLRDDDLGALRVDAVVAIDPRASAGVA